MSIAKNRLATGTVLGIAIAALFVGAYQACSSSSDPGPSAPTVTAAATPSSLSISPSGINMLAGGTTQFFGSGGKSPYTFSISSGNGSILASTGVFTASSSATVGSTTVVTLTDSSSPALTTTATVTITNSSGSTTPTGTALTLMPLTTTVAPNGTITFTASGGTPPYTYAIISGSGTMNSNVLTAGNSDGSQTIVQLTDANGATKTATANVSASVGTSAPTKQIYGLARTKNITEHMYSDNPSEGSQFGYSTNNVADNIYGGPAFKVFTGQISGTHAIYRCLLSGGYHMMSSDSACSGLGQPEGAMGFIYDAPNGNASALYGYYLNNDHVVVTDTTITYNQHFSAESILILGYAPN